MVENIDKGQVVRSAAEVYDEFFVPALFAEWPEPIIQAARIQPGQQVLDVACGTGVLTHAVAEQVGTTGNVIGLDINEGMLAVAAQKAPDIEWRPGPAEALPFPDNHFDAVVSQFGLMFFEDQPAALREMLRVLRPGGHMAVAVWGLLSETPGYLAMVELLQRLFGDEAANGIRAPYNLGAVDNLRALLNAAGINDAQITTRIGTARFPSIDDWVYTDIKGWVLADMLDDAQFDVLLQAARQHLQAYVTADGSVAFAAPGHIISV